MGVTPVNCTATDDAGNEASLGFNVTVTDTTAPSIAAAADINADATGPAGADVAYTAPLATDIVDGALVPVCLPASPVSVAVGGSALVTCDVADTNGNNALPVAFNISVNDLSRTDPGAERV